MTETSSAPVLHTLVGDHSLYRSRPSHFLAAFLGQTLGMVLLIFLINHFSHKGLSPTGGWTLPLTSISFSPAPQEPSGAGGGGDRSTTAASRGALPKMNLQDQLTPPQAVSDNPDPILPEPPSLMAITEAKLPRLEQLGDPLAGVQAPPSNGTGDGGGIGRDCCGGVGTKSGRGFGDQAGPVFRPGVAGVTLPRAIYDPDPAYTEDARRSRHQGSVLLWLVVDAAGQPRSIHLQRALGMGLDEKAIAAVSTWRFQPATLHGKPVAVEINVEVTFRLF